MNDTLEKIFALLKQQNLEQKDLAEHLHIKPQTVSDWKSGKNKSYKKYLSEIAEFLHVSVAYLLGQNEPLPEKASHEEWLAIFKKMDIGELLDIMNQVTQQIMDKRHDQAK